MPERIPIALIGCGGMGTGHLGSLVKRSDADNIKVLAVSDVYQRRLTRALALIAVQCPHRKPELAELFP